MWEVRREQSGTGNSFCYGYVDICHGFCGQAGAKRIFWVKSIWLYYYFLSVDSGGDGFSSGKNNDDSDYMANNRNADAINFYICLLEVIIFTKLVLWNVGIYGMAASV